MEKEYKKEHLDLLDYIDDDSSPDRPQNWDWYKEKKNKKVQ